MFRIFRHYIPKPLLMLGIAEILILLVSVYIGVVLFYLGDLGAAGEAPDPVFNGLLPRAGIFTLVLLLVMTAMGLYQRDLRDSPRTVMSRIWLSFVLGLVLMSLVYHLWPELFIGQGAMVVALVCAFIGIVSCRFIAYQHTENLLKSRVLVIGAGEEAQRIEGLRRRCDNWGVNVVGYVDVVGSGPRLVAEDKLIKVENSLQELVEQQGIDEIVVALDDRRNNIPMEEIVDCKMQGIQVLESTTFFERQLGKIKLETLRPSQIIFSEGFSHVALRQIPKRLFDVLVSSSLLLLTSPVMLFTALAIWAESGFAGSIIYRQERVGAFGRTFQVLKFRSMREDAERDGPRWASADDDRVTRVGRFIRKTRIDELPQLINVLRGEMSFVGPRPERPAFVEELKEKLPYYQLRHYVKPGITGWAQICYPYGSSLEDSKQKLQYDLYYLKNYSLFLDLTILFQTITVVLWGKGAR